MIGPMHLGSKYRDYLKTKREHHEALADCSALSQLHSDPSRIASAIQHSPNPDFFFGYVVIHRKGKALLEHPMVAKHAPVNAGVKAKRFNIGVERLKEIRADPSALPLVESKAVEQVGFSQTEYSKRHARFAALRRSRFFASSQSLNFAFPALTTRSASRNASSCHGGDSNWSSSWERSAQRASIARSFSSRDIFFRGSRIGMGDRKR
jgi:hypothetical protein